MQFTICMINFERNNKYTLKSLFQFINYKNFMNSYFSLDDLEQGTSIFPTLMPLESQRFPEDWARLPLRPLPLCLLRFAPISPWRWCCCCCFSDVASCCCGSAGRFSLLPTEDRALPWRMGGGGAGCRGRLARDEPSWVDPWCCCWGMRVFTSEPLNNLQGSRRPIVDDETTLSIASSSGTKNRTNNRFLF